MTVTAVPLGELVRPAPNDRPGDRQLPVLSMTSAQGLVRQADYFKKAIASRDTTKYKVVKPGQIVVGIHVDEGAIGVSTDVDSGIVSPAYTLWDILEPDLDHHRYLDRFIRSPVAHQYFAAHYRETANRRGKLTRDKFLALEVPLPPIEEQRRIAAVLDAADALRTKRRQALVKLDTLTQAIFIDMFGDLANNSRGWPKLSVNSFVDAFESGKSVAAGPDDVPGGYRVLKVSAVTSRRYRSSESKPVPHDYSAPPSHLVGAGDLLMSRANTSELVGACAFVHETPTNHLLPDKLWRFVWREPRQVEPLYVWKLMQDRRVREQIGDLATGSSGSMKNISQRKFLGLELPVPPLSMQTAFVEQLRRIEETKARAAADLNLMNSLFCSLQQRAFRGEL